MKKKEMYPIRKTNYEEIMNKKLKEFYIIIHVVTVELLMGEGNILEKSKIYMLYGIDIFGRKDIIGLYKENKDNSRYWLEEIEKIKARGLKKVIYVSTEKNKRLEQSFKMIYNPIMKISINEEVERIAKYTQYRWKATGEQELVRAYLSETEEEYREKINELKEKYKENQIGKILIEEFDKEIMKEMQEPMEIRHLICSYSTKRKLKQIITRIEKEYTEVKDIKDLFEKKKEEFSIFEKTRLYSKEKWTKTLNKLYKEKYEEIKEYI